MVAESSARAPLVVATESTAIAAVKEALAVLKDEPERVSRVQSNAQFLRSGLQKLGYDTGLSETAVIPVIYKDEPSAALTARRLRDFGILATPVLFPAVAQWVRDGHIQQFPARVRQPEKAAWAGPVFVNFG